MIDLYASFVVSSLVLTDAMPTFVFYKSLPKIVYTILLSSESTLRDLPKEHKNTILKGNLHSCLLQHYLQQLKYGNDLMSLINGWMNQEDALWRCNGVLLSSQKDKFVPFMATQLELARIMLSKTIWVEKEKYWMVSLI